MIRIALASIGLAILALAPIGQANAEPAPAVDQIGLPGPYEIRGVTYRLAWSSKPSDAYAKHEYLPDGQTPGRHERMVMIEYARGVDPVTAANAKLAELNARKAKDPTVNHAILRNDRTGEILLDFTISAPSPEGGISEWNAYRYAAAEGGVALFALSRRAYGDGRTAFFKGLKAERPADIRALAELPMPKPRLAR